MAARHTSILVILQVYPKKSCPHLFWLNFK